MSYTVYLNAMREIDVFERNHTGNTAKMWRAAGCDLLAFDGAPAVDLEPVLQAAIQDMQSRPDWYREMNPANGWGSYESCLDFLRSLHSACRSHPDAMVEISA